MAKNSVFMNFVSTKLVHERAGKNDEVFYNVSIPYADSKTGFASLSVSKGQKLAATKKGQNNGERVAVEGFCSILLGAPEKTRKLSICTKAATKKKKAEYGTVELTNAQIAEIYEASRQAYKAQNNGDTDEAPAEATDLIPAEDEINI